MKMRSFGPLHHILLMCFLKGSIKAFVESEPSENAFENRLFSCENPVCPHYHTDEILNIEIRCFGGGAKGVFYCAFCVMRYTVNLSSRNPNEAPTIIDYGDLWINELHRCVREKMSLSETAKVFKCSKYAISYRKKKHGLVKPMPYDSQLDAAEYYKTQILELCKKHGEVSLASLREQIPNAYSYLVRHDHEWLRKHIVYKKDHDHEHDLRLLSIVQNAVDKIKTDGDSERRITIGYIAEIAEIKSDSLKCLQRKPNTQAFIESVIECEEDWIRRRIISVFQNMVADGVPFFTTTLKHYMRAHPYTYLKYQELIDGVIKEFR